MSSLADATFAFASDDAASQSEAAGSSPLTDFSIRIARPKPIPLSGTSRNQTGSTMRNHIASRCRSEP
jgi:hypothetical protein